MLRFLRHLCDAVSPRLSSKLRPHIPGLDVRKEMDHATTEEGKRLLGHHQKTSGGPRHVTDVEIDKESQSSTR